MNAADKLEGLDPAPIGWIGIMILLRQLSFDIKKQLKVPKAPKITLLHPVRARVEVSDHEVLLEQNLCVWQHHYIAKITKRGFRSEAIG